MKNAGLSGERGEKNADAALCIRWNLQGVSTFYIGIGDARI
jgi:hypothetical protein